MSGRSKIVAVDEHNNRIGEDHPRAKLTDHDVELIRQLREEFGLAHSEIAVKFEIAKSTVVAICQYQRRATTPAGYRRVTIDFQTKETPNA